MATIKEFNISGGSLGNVVFVRRGDKTFVRVKPSKVKNPKTQAQQANRNKFTQMAKILSPLKPLLKVSFGNTDKLVSGYNKAMSINLNQKIIADSALDFCTDFDKLIVGKGSLLQPQNAHFEIEGSNMHVHWSAQCTTAADKDDTVLLTVYNTTKKDAYSLIQGIGRINGYAQIALPSWWNSNDTCFVYLSFARQDYSKTSDSVCLGHFLFANEVHH